jgi:hypothetical protein
MSSQFKIKQRPVKPGQPVQMNVDLRNAVQKACACGCKRFTPAVEVYTISALASPTGHEMIIQKPVLVCMDCGAVMEIKGA